MTIAGRLQILNLEMGHLPADEFSRPGAVASRA